MRPSIFSGLFFVATLAATALAGCSAEEGSTGQGEDDYTARGAKQGETCANGVFGTPNIPCASGLECVFAGGSNAPAGPSGSSSATTGTCQPTGAKQGETCANGVFGTPNIPCASGLECVFEGGSNAPAGPSGSSSAKTGTCQPAGAGEGEMCANGVFGTPNIPCADGLVCKFPNGSSAPTGPSGSSSASTGTCAKP